VLNYESIVADGEADDVLALPERLRAEALILLRDGLNAHLDPDTLPAEPPARQPPGPPAGRLPRGHRRLLRLQGPAGRGPPAPARAGRRERLGGAGSGLNPRSGNGFA
jgi:hypothetical protein